MNKTVSLKTAKALKEAGIEIETEHVWVQDREEIWRNDLDSPEYKTVGNPYPTPKYLAESGDWHIDKPKILCFAPDIAELLDYLPRTIRDNYDLIISPAYDVYTVAYWDAERFMAKVDYKLCTIEHESLPEALAQLALHLKQQGII